MQKLKEQQARPLLQGSNVVHSRLPLPGKHANLERSNPRKCCCWKATQACRLLRHAPSEMTLATGSGPAIQPAINIEDYPYLTHRGAMHAARLSRMSNALAWVSTFAEDSNLQ